MDDCELAMTSPDGLVGSLIFLGVAGLLAALAQYSMRDTFGERVSENLRRSGMVHAAKKWNKERGERVSMVGVWVFGSIGAASVLGGVALLVFAR